MELWPNWYFTANAWRFAVPIWIPAIVSFVIAAGAWRLDFLARRRDGACFKCNYDRTGLAAGAVCPECGSAPG